MIAQQNIPRNIPKARIPERDYLSEVGLSHHKFWTFVCDFEMVGFDVYPYEVSACNGNFLKHAAFYKPRLRVIRIGP